MTANRRELTRLDLACLGINSVVGSSIFLYPGTLAALLGPGAIGAFLLTALILTPVGLCFAEAASTRDKPGGPALYVEEAFGHTAGFAIGWLCFVTQVVSFAAVATGLATYASPFWPALQGPVASKLVAAVAICAVTAVNLKGAKPGARVTTGFTFAKLVPLFAIVLFGLPLLFRNGVGTMPEAGWSALPKACFLIYFAFQGFEVVPVPAGEAKNPGKDAPFAVLVALLGSAVLYALVQAVALAAVPNLAGSERPLAEAGRALFGPAGETLISAGALISMTGFIAGCALGAPRYLVALADEKHLPAHFGRRSPGSGAPVNAVLWNGAVALVGAFLLDFQRLVDFANVVVCTQYIGTCAVVLVERRRGRKAAYRAPGGPLIPVAGIAATLWLGAQGGWMQVVGAAVALALGFVLRSAASSLDKA